MLSELVDTELLEWIEAAPGAVREPARRWAHDLWPSLAPYVAAERVADTFAAILGSGILGVLAEHLRRAAEKTGSRELLDQALAIDRAGFEALVAIRQELQTGNAHDSEPMPALNIN